MMQIYEILLNKVLRAPLLFTGSVSSIIGSYKSAVSKHAHRLGLKPATTAPPTLSKQRFRNQGKKWPTDCRNAGATIGPRTKMTY
jgi:hypothetical protein